MTIEGRFGFGVVGGLGALAGADFLQKLTRVIEQSGEQQRYAVVFEQQTFPGSGGRTDACYDPTARKLHGFSLARRLETREVDAILLPCFVSQTFIGEIAANISAPIVDLMAALRQELTDRHPAVRRIGVLTSDYVRERALFERTFTSPFEIVYPSKELQASLMDAIYSDGGIKTGRVSPATVGRVAAICHGLEALGCEVILPGFTELSLILEELRPRVGCGIVDPNEAYAQFAVAGHHGVAPKQFKIGIVGGVGPAATVDFMDKVVRVTSASRDQDHVKMIVEQNPQIPDRTEHLIGSGIDPTIALLATCKKLEYADADIVAIPCNTAHAFVERIQPYLRVPIVNMLAETMARVSESYPDKCIGLLATSGTVQSRVYANAARAVGVNLIVPDAAHQELVMDAIYGPEGVKAGFTEGKCEDSLDAAVRHLVHRGARVIVLGCTELPLILPSDEHILDGKRIALIDPTLLLAEACVRHARGSLLTARNPTDLRDSFSSGTQ